MPEPTPAGDLSASLTRSAALRRAARMLAEAGIAEARGDARHLGLHILGLTPTDLALRGGEAIGAAGAEALAHAMRRRLSGEPVARILGEWEFRGLTFALSADTLVPRPDTETLVETALTIADGLPKTIRLVDLGTGSGCIVTALLAALPGAHGLGIDLSEGALRTARANAARNGVGNRALFLQGDWFAPVAGPFDLIVSNPPYIVRTDIATLSQEVRLHDPLAALDGGVDGLDAYRAILGEFARRPRLLAPEGVLLFEIGYDQAAAVLRLGQEVGLSALKVARDLAGHDRVIAFRHASATLSGHSPQ